MMVFVEQSPTLPGSAKNVYIPGKRPKLLSFTKLLVKSVAIIPILLHIPGKFNDWPVGFQAFLWKDFFVFIISINFYRAVYIYIFGLENSELKKK